MDLYTEKILIWLIGGIDLKCVMGNLLYECTAICVKLFFECDSVLDYVVLKSMDQILFQWRASG